MSLPQCDCKHACAYKPFRLKLWQRALSVFLFGVNASFVVYEIATAAVWWGTPLSAICAFLMWRDLKSDETVPE